jgi:hypothetical protein
MIWESSAFLVELGAWIMVVAYHAQGVIAAVLVQIADLERGNLGAPQPDLQADAEDRAIAQACDRVFRRPIIP